MRVLTLVGFRLNFISFWFLGRAFTLYYAWFLIFTLITRVLDLKKQTIRQLLFMFFDSKLTLLGLIYYHTCVSVANLRNLNNTDTFYTILFEMDLQRIIIPIIREPLDVKRERVWRLSWAFAFFLVFPRDLDLRIFHGFIFFSVVFIALVAALSTAFW